MTTQSSSFRRTVMHFAVAVLIVTLLSHRPTDWAARAADPPQKYALLVAVSKYNHASMNKPALEYPEVDAADLAKLLRASGYSVDLLAGSSAKQQAIREKLAGLKNRGNVRAWC